MIPLRSALASSLVPVALVLALGACKTTPTPPGIGIRGSGATKLMERAPIDIAVLPVVNSAGKNVPSPALRSAFQQALVARRYSPLALDYVDRNTTEAAYNPDSARDQAVLSIAIERWDMSMWDTQNALQVKLVVRITDPASGSPDELWSGSVDQRFEFGSTLDTLATQSARIQFACETIAAEVLEKLPIRDARRGSS